MFAEIKFSECGIMIHCQLDDQIESPADFSHFDPICLLALAPPTSPVLERGRVGARSDGRKSAAACARGSSSSVEEEAAAAAAVGSCDGRDFRRRRRSWRSPSLRCSPSLHPSSSFSACLPARPPRAPRPPPARPPSCNHIPTDLRRWNSQLQSLQDSSEGQTDFFHPSSTPREV